MVAWWVKAGIIYADQWLTAMSPSYAPGNYDSDSWLGLDPDSTGWNRKGERGL